ncbi:hypothetical protein AAFC00_003340 [Neodothiora populina]
MHRM